MTGKIIIAGGNGFLGLALTDYFRGRAEKIVLLSRKKFDAGENAIVRIWDGENIGDWASELEGAEVLINLCGKNVNCRYTDKNKQAIYDSRLKSTKVLGKAVAGCQRPPRLWINSSSATIYRASFNKFMTEETGETGDDFSMDVCKRWEAAFTGIHLHPDVRKVIFRTSIVLGNRGGALPALKTLVRFGFGGSQGNGKQYCSWIHERDFCRAIEFVINRRHAEGIFNVCVPAPLRNRDFMRELQIVLGAPLAISIPQWALEVGAFMIRTETELILKSRKVFPKRLLDEGFVFEFNEAKAAFEDLCRTKRRIKQDFTLSH
jgi:uncharacterized protein